MMLASSILLISSVSSVVPAYAASNLTVDLSSVIGPVTHGAAGSLYGVIENQPDNNLIIPLHAKAYNNPAVSGYQQPWGAAVPVAQKLVSTGSQVSIRLADWYPGWYDYSNLTDWFNKMTTTVNAVKAAGLTNIYGYELWNEPDGTWKGKYVGGINDSNSYVEFTVNVPAAQNYTLHIHYANGTGASSTHNLSVNGGSTGVITYPNTGGWFAAGSAGSLNTTVSLHAGTNTIRFTKGSAGYAEIDYIDVIGGSQVRYEAENATLNNSIKYSSGNTSSDVSGNLTFSEFFSQSYKKLKQLDPSAKAIGPSYAAYRHNTMQEFISYQKSQNTVPDITSWHQLNNENFTNDFNDYRAIESSLGITAKPISINEYSASGWQTDEGKPGAVAPLIAKFERLKVDTAMQSYWDVPNPGRLGSLLSSSTQRNGGWWFYKWYGDMTGNMVNTTPPNVNDTRALDGFANVDATRKYASVLFGGNTDGSVNATIKNFPSFFGGNGSKVHVRVDWTPFVNKSTAVNTTNTLLEGDYTISNGQITVPMTGLYNNDGYRIYMTPYGQATNVYEAEDAAVSHANIASGSQASGGKYVAQIDYNDSYVDFYVKVPTTKTYSMTIRYANGTGASSTQNLAYNGGPFSTVTYHATSGWGQFGTVNVNVNLTAGDNIIRLMKGSTGYAEIDNITLN
ncbi:CBM35 domain-containing protein [Paenibacillus hexagrammi]|uniref:Carbohydrate-binding protein n=1 Tax=Paenibacillus hexagrammi TaxID=2908839 RepID=A0ABY3SR12_9BACL|nr:CBM35 domain-containing protein [Paenibacillus sp. YPD9-1]UJF36434.1 carbohydrate-binding protein [Paenibacillus sp. YPD9-1]